MVRGQTPGPASLPRIAAKLGPEIYDLLGLPRPDPDLQAVISNWGRLSDETKAEIAAAIERAIARDAQSSRKRVGKAHRQ